MAVYVKLDQQGIREIFESKNGPVGREVLRQAKRVETKAKQLCPVDTGRLRASITTELGTEGDRVVARIGTNVKYATFIHTGTGIHGPKGVMITPKRGKLLVFTPRGGQKVFATQVKGVKGTPFLVDALKAVG